MSAAAGFAERFASYWQAPSPSGLDSLLAPDVYLRAPMTPTTHDLAGAKSAFAHLLGLVPDLTGRVHRWGATEDGLLIEFTLSGRVAGVEISWEAVDRITLRDDGLATARISYFDSAVLARTAALHPRTWPTFLRLRAGV